MKTQMPKVLLITGDFPPFLTGVGDYTDRLGRHLHVQGVDVTVLTSVDAGDGAARPFEVRRDMPDWSMRHRRRLLEHCRGFDLVHIQYPGVHYGRSALVNLLPWMLRGPRCVATFHEFRTMRRRWQLRTLPMLGGLDAVIHVDPDDRRLLRQWCFPRRQMFAAPIASNVEPVACDAARRAKLRSELGLAADEMAVVFFGILYPHKGVTELLQAVAMLKARGAKVRPVVVGDFDRQADYRPAMETALSGPGVVWVRNASLERVSQVLHASDIAMLPFHSGAGINRSSLLASLEHGLPIITTDGRATPPDFNHRFDVLLTPPRDIDALASALERLLSDAPLRERMRQSARSNAAATAWPQVARRHLDIYRQVLDPIAAAERPDAVDLETELTSPAAFQGGTS